MEQGVNGQHKDMLEAVTLAVDSCIRDGILEDILREHKEEAIDMLLTEFDEAEARQVFYEDGFEDGREQEREQVLRALMQTTGWNLQRAMDALMIPQDARPEMERRLTAPSGT